MKILMVIGIIAILATTASALNRTVETSEPTGRCLAPADCEGGIHIMCLGEWDCVENRCVWECKEPEEPPQEPPLSRWMTFMRMLFRSLSRARYR